ncbi:MAG: hypothetical protein HY840_10030 [Bacteroidetes bacterium]|nr:hypothetical protein [Bacteroidota bacterium]
MSGSNKSLLFFLGLLLGILAGASFFIFKMDGILKKASILNKSKDTVSIQQVNNTEEENKTNIKKYIGQQLAPSRKDTPQKSMTSAELLAKKYSKEVSVRKVMEEADSLLHDDILANKDTSINQNIAESFVVRKDELLNLKNFEVINLQQNETENPSDSLLEKLSGIKNTKKNSIASFNVEFWQSPINYKGYKMTKNKIVLFGINPEGIIKLFHLDDCLFMKNNQNYYKLYFTDDFKQFEKVSDTSVIAKLK